MLCLVQCVYRDPSQRSFTGFRVVVDDHPLPVVGAKSGKDIAEQLCRVSELAGHILRLLLGVPIVNNSLIASRWGTVRPIHPAGGEHSFALHEQHVAQMAAILKGRPHARLPPGSQVNLSVAQDCHNLRDPLPDILLDRPRLSEVVNEAAVRTLIRHLAIVVPQGSTGLSALGIQRRANAGACSGRGPTAIRRAGIRTIHCGARDARRSRPQGGRGVIRPDSSGPIPR